MRYALAALAALALTGCGGSSSAVPRDDSQKAALKVLDQIVHNRYTEAWDDLHPADQAVAPRGEYVTCESRSPVISIPRSVRAVGIKDESIGLGDGSFVPSKAVALRLGFAGGLTVTPTVHRVVEVDPAVGAHPRRQGGPLSFGRRLVAAALAVLALCFGERELAA